MARFFINPEDICNNIAMIHGDDVKHIRNVLRLVPGNEITLCDGFGTDFEAVILEIANNLVKAEVKAKFTNKNEPPVRISLFQALPKLDKMDYIIQKCVEIGIFDIFPVMTSRSVSKINSTADAAKKRDRWQRISMEAAKQCGRGIIPEIHMPVSFEKALERTSEFDLRLIPYESESVKNDIRNLETGNEIKSVMVFIGPEGGFDASEISKATDNGMSPVRFGPRILRTETAGIAIISILMHLFGDM